jgi:16S rRNA (cytidine1402-2'-O)-methyltransferase
MNNGKLYVIPSVIAENATDTIPPQVRAVLPSIRIFLVENVRTARRFLSSLKIYDSIEELTFHVLDKDTKDIAPLMSSITENNIGILSESGCPGIADPGALAVAYAHEKNIQVIPLVGRSSLLMALMASGLNGQQFVFHGYLPIDSKVAADQLRSMEKDSKKKLQTQMFIETPYRNNQLFELMLKTLQKTTLLTVAVDVTGKGESIQTKAIAKWLSNKAVWPKEPAVFLFLAQ